MNQTNVIAKIEAMLFAAAQAVEVEKLANVLELDCEAVHKLVEHLAAQYDDRNSGLCIVKTGDKYEICTRKEHGEQIRQLLEIRKNAPLSQAAFEVLAIIAYNQPVTRSFIEQVRGVDSSGSVVNLMQKGLVEERGRLDLPGRPLVYGTTDRFLKCFCIETIDDLPPLPTNNENLDEQTKLEEFVDKVKLDEQTKNAIEEINTSQTDD